MYILWDFGHHSLASGPVFTSLLYANINITFCAIGLIMATSASRIKFRENCELKMISLNNKVGPSTGIYNLF